MNGDYSKLHNSEAEYMVIGACITNPDIYFSIQERLRTQLFTEYDCRKAIIIIHQMVEQGKQPDMTEVTPLLAKEAVDIARFLTLDCVSFEVTKQRLNLLEDLYVRRKVYEICSKGEALTSDPTVQTEDLQVLVKEFDSVLNNTEDDNVVTFEQVVTELVNDAADRKNGKKDDMGMLTGLHIFDSRYGWHGGDLVIIAGEPSQGKSTLATTIAYNMACSGLPVAYYSLEMSGKQLVSRIIASRVKLSAAKTLYDKLSDNEYQSLYDGSLALKKLPIFFDEKSRTSFPATVSSIKRMVKLKGVRVVFIDYLQIYVNGHDDNREQLLGDMARDLKRLAVDTNTCIVALSQLNRAKEKGGVPSMSRMRGSGQIEEACDVAVLVYRPNPNKEMARLKMDKGRMVGVAEENVRFNGMYSYFSDYQQGDPDAVYKEHDEKLPF